MNDLLYTTVTKVLSRALAAAIPCVVVLGIPSVVDARDHNLQHLGTRPSSDGAIATDGVSVAVRNTPSGPIRLRGKVASQLDEPGCRVTAPRDARLVSLCDGKATLLDLRTRERFPLIGYDTLRQRIDLIGTRPSSWIQGDRGNFPEDNTRFYTNWRTGETRIAAPSAALRNVDSPTLTGVQPALALGHVILGESDARVALVSTQSIRLRDGRATITVRRRCRPRCNEVRLSAGIVTWSEGRTVHVYAVATRRLVSLRPSPKALLRYGVTGMGSVSHTRDAVYVTYGREPGDSRPGVEDFWADIRPFMR